MFNQDKENTQKLLNVWLGRYASAKDKREFIITHIANIPEAIRAVFFLCILTENPTLFDFVPEKIKNDETFFLKAIKSHSQIMQYATDKLKNDEEFFLKEIEAHPELLEYANNTLKDKETALLQFIEKNESAITYASDRLKYNKEFIPKAIKANHKIIEYVLHYEKNILKYCFDEIANFQFFILEIIEKDPFQLQHLLFREDKAIVHEAITQNGHTFKYAADHLKNNKTFILSAIKTIWQNLPYENKELKMIVLLQAEKVFDLLSYISCNLIADSDLYNQMIKQSMIIIDGKFNKTKFAYFNALHSISFLILKINAIATHPQSNYSFLSDMIKQWKNKNITIEDFQSYLSTLINKSKNQFSKPPRFYKLQNKLAISITDILTSLEEEKDIMIENCSAMLPSLKNTNKISNSFSFFQPQNHLVTSIFELLAEENVSNLLKQLFYEILTLKSLQKVQRNVIVESKAFNK